MKKLLLNILFISSHAFSFELGQYFTRIHESEEGPVSQCAYRSYFKEDEKNPGNILRVQLIGMQHMAVPEFYEEVESMIKGKVVLYELLGSTIEENISSEARWTGLPSPYRERYLRFFKNEKPDNLLRVSQRCLSYQGCQELIHADSKHGFDSPPLDPTAYEINFNDPSENDFAWISKYGSEDQFKKLINGKILRAMANHYIVCDENNIDENLPELLQKIDHEEPNPSSVILSEIERFYEKQCRKDADFIRSLVFEPSNIPRINSFYKFIKIDRNEFIFAALKALWERVEIPSDVVVVYGVGHMPLVEDFLLAQGFQPLAGSDGWLSTVKLEKISLVIDL